MEKDWKQTDYELVKNKDYTTIWTKYQGLLNVFYYKCVDQITHSGCPFDDYDNIQDFFYDCYPIVVKAVDSIKLNKIKKPATWTLYIQLYHYMQNFVNRDIIFPKLKEYANGFQFVEFDSEDHNGLLIDNNDYFSKIENEVALNQLKNVAESLGPRYVKTLDKALKGNDYILKNSPYIKEILNKYKGEMEWEK